MSRRHRFVGVVGLAVAQLRSDRARLAFAVVGVAVAVLAVTLLLGVGTGVTQTGETLLEQSGRDLWVTGGPIEIQPTSVGGFQNPVVDAHEVATAIESHAGVRAAVPMAFQVVYVSTDGEDFEQLLGSGVSGGGPAVSLTAGEGLSGSAHYANGTYGGPFSHEVIVDPDTAARYDLAVGDRLYVGGSIANAQRNPFTVVGISPTFRAFLRTPTVTLHLSELQTLTGSAYADRATLIAVTLREGVDSSAIAADLAAAHPDVTVRSNREQFRAVLGRQSVVIVGGLSLVVLAVVAGMALSLNLFLSLTYAQRRDLAVFRAIGGGRWVVLGPVVVQALLVGLLGGLLGVALTPLAATALSAVAGTVTGYEGLLQVPLAGYLVGLGVALGFGVVGAAVGGWRLLRGGVVDNLSR